MADELDGVIDSTGMVRRTFVRRLVTGTVFATPVVASFAMAGVEAASAAAHDRHPGPPQGNANQTQIINPNQPCGPQSQFGGGPPASDNPPPFWVPPSFGPPQGSGAP
jgi:hypothetical protein